MSREYSRNPLQYAASNIFQYNCTLIDAIADIVPAVKVQAAYYEMYGCEGMKAFRDTIVYAKNAGLVVIADVKRNDIGATATAYSSAYLGRTKIGDEELPVFDADFATVNGYLGTDGIAPFVEDCKKYKKGIFVLVKTSNKSSGELQDLKIEGKTVYERMADLVEQWGSECVGKDVYKRQVRDGREAVTNYRVLCRYEGYTLVECALQTGRTHQIRVHLKHMGFPVVGDRVYTKQADKFRLNGQLLRALKLELTHPRTGERMKFYAPLPDYFKKVLRTLQNRNEA